MRASLAAALGVRRASIELVSGATHRRKRFRFITLTGDELAARLTAPAGSGRT